MPNDQDNRLLPGMNQLKQLQQLQQQRTEPATCCSPTRMSGIQLIHFDAGKAPSIGSALHRGELSIFFRWKYHEK